MGGFLEVGLAMMVITAGVMVLLLGIILVQENQGNQPDEEALQDFAQDLTACILADKDLMQQDGVLRSSSLYLLDEMTVPEASVVTGFQVRLGMMDRAEEAQIVLVHGLVPDEVALLVSLRTPIGLALSLNEVHPAFLEVLVW